jgi:hypothetical protein
MYPMTASQKGDYASNAEFARSLFMHFKQKNKDEGINGAQALWMHHKIRALNVAFPGMTATVQDVVNMGASGDIETACLCLIYCQPDDMTQPYHWLNAERISWLVARMKEHLGWP